MTKPRLAPIERPPTWFLRMAGWISRRRLGAVMSPLKVIYARQPALLAIAAHMDWVRERKLSLEPGLRLLISAKASMINGCAFCNDLILAQALARNLGRERFAALGDPETSPHFSERERAALALVDEVTRTRNLSDEGFERVRQHFTEAEVVELLWLNAVENFFNLQAHPLGLGSDGLADLVRR